MKVFISQPMRGKADEQILAERERAIRQAEDLVGNRLEPIDSFFKGSGLKPLQLLAKSLELLAEADLAYFVRGWQDARGCRIEHECALQYGVRIIEE